MEKSISILLLLSFCILNSSCKSKKDSSPESPPVGRSATLGAGPSYPYPSPIATAEECSDFLKEEPKKTPPLAPAPPVGGAAIGFPASVAKTAIQALGKPYDIKKAIGYDSDRCVAYILENFKVSWDESSEAFRFAIVTRKTKSAKLFVSRGVQPKDPTRKTALMLAIESKHFELFNFLIQSASVEAINAQDTNGQTPLMFAAKADLSQVLQALLNKGANPNIQDNSGKTALDHSPVTSEVRAILNKTLLN